MVKIYNLDAIISVGYRVNTKEATQFRIWATDVLKGHILDGYSINDKILLESKDKMLELQNKISKMEEEHGELKKINHLKSEFLSIATPQIRGPLGAIRGYISLLLEGDYGKVPDEFIEPLDIIFRSTDSLNKTVNDFLDISRIEQGEMKYYFKDLDVSLLVNDVVKEFSPNITKNNLELRLKITKGLFFVHEDKTKLKHVFSNLVDNAIKYTKTGWIEIGLNKNSENTVLFSVKDSGVGIAKETMSLLFKKFSRAHDAHGANILGTGLGLYVAQKMLEKRGGRIWAESDGKEKGSGFYVELGLVKGA